MRKFLRIVGLTLLCFLPASYNACSSSHSGSSEADLLSAGKCSLQENFSRTVHPFLRTNCKSCHVQSGEGKGAFAEADVSVAYRYFDLVGYAKITRQATNIAHKPPYTGPHLQPAVDEMSAQWAQAEADRARCLAGEFGSPTLAFNEAEWLHTKSRAIGADSVGDTVTITWNLKDDFLNTGISIPAISGARFSIKVKVNEVQGQPYYMITDPTLNLIGANTDVIVDGLRVKINGDYVDEESTFFEMHGELRRGNRQLLASGVMNGLGILKSTDVMSLSFRSMQAVDLGPAPAPVTANFRVSNFTPSAEGGKYEVWVDLSQAIPTHAVVVNLREDASTNATPIFSGRQVLNEDGDNVQINNYDWDYKLSSRSMTFLPGEVSKKIEIEVGADDRYDRPAGLNEFVRLVIDSVNGATVGTNRNYTLTIPDDDVMPDPYRTVATYTDLMSTGGVFATYCIRCHNTVNAKGGYDVTDYNYMRANGILIPGSLSSKMYQRIEFDTPELQRMPINSSLNYYERSIVTDYIVIGGAKND